MIARALLHGCRAEEWAGTHSGALHEGLGPVPNPSPADSAAGRAPC